ncbi:hypothetical protein RTP6_000367 [Batrachochytrium dendrobatidis]
MLYFSIHQTFKLFILQSNLSCVLYKTYTKESIKGAMGHDTFAHISTGASHDSRSPYSTTSSTTYVNWLPIYQSKFTLHLKTPEKHAAQSSFSPTDIAQPTQNHGRKQIIKPGTGFSKNCSSYVEYDPAIDETQYQFSKEAHLTSHGQSYISPQNATKKSSKPLYIAQDVIESGFTRLPKYNVTDQGQQYLTNQSEAKSKFTESAHVLHQPSADRSRILQSSSAFTTDVGHLHAFGHLVDSPFANVQTKQDQWRQKSEKMGQYRMDPNGFTRSVGSRILDYKTNPLGIISKNSEDHIRKSDPARWMMMHETDQSTSNYVHCRLSPIKDAMTLKKLNESIGSKQDTGSIRNNRPFMGGNIQSTSNRFTTETSDQFTKPISNFKSDNFKCDSITQSGFTISNKYKYTMPIDSEAGAQ